LHTVASILTPISLRYDKAKNPINSCCQYTRSFDKKQFVDDLEERIRTGKNIVNAQFIKRAFNRMGNQFYKDNINTQSDIYVSSRLALLISLHSKDLLVV